MQRQYSLLPDTTRIHILATKLEFLNKDSNSSSGNIENSIDSSIHENSIHFLNLETNIELYNDISSGYRFVGGNIRELLVWIGVLYSLPTSTSRYFTYSFNSIKLNKNVVSDKSLDMQSSADGNDGIDTRPSTAGSSSPSRSARSRSNSPSRPGSPINIKKSKSSRLNLYDGQNDDSKRVYQPVLPSDPVSLQFQRLFPKILYEEKSKVRVLQEEGSASELGAPDGCIIATVPPELSPARKIQSLFIMGGKIRPDKMSALHQLIHMVFMSH